MDWEICIFLWKQELQDRPVAIRALFLRWPQQHILMQFHRILMENIQIQSHLRLTTSIHLLSGKRMK